ncbi:ChuX/HutX family heme-like substrate-binding protein [Alcaligenaceae bacterium C4P045]|nr:ChuX/HutX family heme-like substrate-binding protein [Alcaligenaceae bacterium C4P045]
MNNIVTPTSAAAFSDAAAVVRARYAAEAERLSGQRARQAADALGVSEAQWVAAGCAGIESTPLQPAFQALFRQLPEVGRVMALTRNDWCVHERHGRYEDVRADGPMGLVLGPDIDLRVFFFNWASAWSVNDAGRRSLQFFDMAGMAVHKIYATAETDMAAFEALVDAHRHAAPVWPDNGPAPERPAPRGVKDAAALRTDWRAMTDTHQFFPLLKKHDADRLAALEAAGADLAQPVAIDAVETVLTGAAADGIAIMCFVANRGMIQIHSGPIHTLRRTGPWYNVLDPDFNLHLNTTAIAQVWVVNKPTADGWVTSLEVYNAAGDLIVQFFGARKPGQAELPAWRRTLAALCGTPLAQ